VRLSLFLSRKEHKDPINLSAISDSLGGRSLGAEMRTRNGLSGCKLLDETEAAPLWEEKKGEREESSYPCAPAMNFSRSGRSSTTSSRQDRNRETVWLRSLIRAIRLKFVITGMATLPLPSLTFPLVSRGRNGFSIPVSD
jgi:hypothetical protein